MLFYFTPLCFFPPQGFKVQSSCPETYLTAFFLILTSLYVGPNHLCQTVLLCQSLYNNGAFKKKTHTQKTKEICFWILYL